MACAGRTSRYKRRRPGSRLSGTCGRRCEKLKGSILPRWHGTPSGRARGRSSAEWPRRPRQLTYNRSALPHCMAILVTGAAGFIGSHVAEHLLRRGHEVVGVDDLSGGFLDNVPEGTTFVEGSILDTALLSRLF